MRRATLSSNPQDQVVVLMMEELTDFAAFFGQHADEHTWQQYQTILKAYTQKNPNWTYGAQVILEAAHEARGLEHDPEFDPESGKVADAVGLLMRWLYTHATEDVLNQMEELAEPWEKGKASGSRIGRMLQYARSFKIDPWGHPNIL